MAAVPQTFRQRMPALKSPKRLQGFATANDLPPTAKASAPTADEYSSIDHAYLDSLLRYIHELLASFWKSSGYSTPTIADVQIIEILVNCRLSRRFANDDLRVGAAAESVCEV
jgi:hypothetical protein